MPTDALGKLAALIQQDRRTLLASWRNQVRELPSAKHLDTPTLNDHIPALIDELAHALRSRSDETIPEALSEGTPPAHGLQRVADGYDIEEVVAEYNILRGCIHDLADSNGLSLQGKAFHILNRVLDSAIGMAVQTYANQRALEVQQRREEYLAFVAHDLRTPLNAIALATRVLEVKFHEHGGSPESTQMLNTLRRNVQHLDALVGKILEDNSATSEKGLKLERRMLDLWPLVEAILQDLQPVARTSETKLENRVPDELYVYADASLLRRVFQNLVANAIAWTPRGEVSVSARDHGQDKGVECWVVDTGTGIPPDRIDRLFDPTDQGSPEKDGHGLGLTIVRTFVEAHGGRVTVESQLGAGATFRFLLPPRIGDADPRKSIP